MRLDALYLAKKNGSAHTSVEKTNERLRRTEAIDYPAFFLVIVIISCCRVQRAISDGSELSQPVKYEARKNWR